MIQRRDWQRSMVSMAPPRLHTVKILDKLAADYVLYFDSFALLYYDNFTRLKKKALL